MPQSPAPYADLSGFIDNGASVGESTLALAVRHSLSGATPDLAIEFVGNRIDLSQLDKSGGAPHGPAEFFTVIEFIIANNSAAAVVITPTMSFDVTSLALTTLGGPATRCKSSRAPLRATVRHTR